MKDRLQKFSLPAIIIAGRTIEFPSLKWDVSTVEGVVDMITGILNFAVGFSAVVAVGMIIYGGYVFITANGDPENISKGGKILTAAIVGMAIVFLARFVVSFILNEFLL